MTDFFTFYLMGGVFNHAITIVMIVGLTAVALHARGRKLGEEGNKRLRVADRMAALCVAFGVLGTMFGLIDVFTALQNVGAADFGGALARGMRIAPMTLAWSLMCAIPIWIASTVHHGREPIPPRRREA